MRPFSRQVELLETVPGVGRATVQVLIAETGGDMARFRTAGHLASWAGVCPGHHESAGKHSPAADATATDGSARPWAPPPWPPPALATAP
jgi:transposase